LYGEKGLMYVGRHGGGASGPASGKEAGSISVVLKESGEVLVDNRIVDVRAVRANVERLHAQKPEWGVMVTAEQNAAAGGPQITTAEKPWSPIEKGLAAPGLLAYVIVSKYSDHLNLYLTPVRKYGTC
jgi:hypothetical protein